MERRFPVLLVAGLAVLGAACSAPKPVVALYAERLVASGSDPVASVFGFPDDMSACRDIAVAISKHYNGRKFFCAFATQREIADAGFGR